MKKKKLALTNLKLQSFVTSFEQNEEETVKEGGRGSFIICESLNVCSAGCSDVSHCLCSFSCPNLCDVSQLCHPA